MIKVESISGLPTAVNLLPVNYHIWFVKPKNERPGKSTGPVSYFEIEVSRKLGCVLTSNEVHFVSLAENFTA